MNRTIEGMSGIAGVEPEFLKMKLDLGRILDESEDYVRKLMIKVGTIIPFTETSEEVPAESKEEMAKAARYAGNSLAAHIMSIVLLEIYPLMKVRNPKSRYGQEAVIKHPSASFVVMDYAPLVRCITAKDPDETQYHNIMKHCDETLTEHSNRQIDNGSCKYNPQIAAQGHIDGGKFKGVRLEDISEDLYLRRNFGKRLITSKNLGFALNGELIVANRKEGLSAEDVRDVVEGFIERYKMKV